MNQKHKQSKLKLAQKPRLQGKKNKFAKNPSNPTNPTPQPNSLNHHHPQHHQTTTFNTIKTNVAMSHYPKT